MFTQDMTNTCTAVSSLHAEARRLAEVLVHDCNGAEDCFCFSAADVRRYEAAQREYEQARTDEAHAAIKAAGDAAGELEPVR